MKILLYTDNHFCSYSSIIRDRGQTFSVRLENQINTLNWLEHLSVDNKCEIEICLGDFFDKESLNSEELSALKCIDWNNIKKYFIVGNHEMGNHDLTFNSLNALSKVGMIIDKPTLIEDNFANIILLPYVLESDRQKLSTYIDKAYFNSKKTEFKNNPAIILSHNDIAGINYAGFKSKAGFSIDEIEEESDIFLNGHLHNRSNISNRIKLLGNVTGLNFSEDAKNYNHCAYILDTETLSLQEFENPYAFNFYKIDITKEQDIENLSNLKSNSIVAVKCAQRLLDVVKSKINSYENIIKFRITIIPEIVIAKTDEPIIIKDHIQQFKNYVLQNYGTDDIIQEELGRL